MMKKTLFLLTTVASLTIARKNKTFSEPNPAGNAT
jgi:hypothetical protein